MSGTVADAGAAAAASRRHLVTYEHYAAVADHPITHTTFYPYDTNGMPCVILACPESTEKTALYAELTLNLPFPAIQQQHEQLSQGLHDEIAGLLPQIDASQIVMLPLREGSVIQLFLIIDDPGQHVGMSSTDSQISLWDELEPKLQTAKTNHLASLMSARVMYFGARIRQ